MSGPSRLCVVGLGKMGLPLAALYAARGLTVIGCDIDARVVDAVNQGEALLPNEPGVTEMVIDAVRDGRLRATTDTQAAVAASDVVIIIVPLMLADDAQVDYEGFDAAVLAVGRGLQPGTLVLLETTLPVGDTRNRFAPLLERASGLRTGKEFFLAFSPERVQSNRVLNDLAQYPKIVGGVDEQSTALATEFYTRALGATVLPLSTAEAAEFTKLAECVYRDVNIALANELAKFAETAGIDMAEVIPAANSEPLSHLHTPGLGVGGHCIPVYPYFLLNREPGLGLLARARAVNDGMPRHVVSSVMAAMDGATDVTVLVLGLTYRANVKELHHSPALTLVELFQAQGVKTLVHDPYVTRSEMRALGLDGVDLAALPAVQAVVLHSFHTAYHTLDFTAFQGCKVVVDGPGVLNASDLEQAGRRYVRVGRGTRQLSW